jgi:uncharacterized surface protein with fasciclin (FAS1) repeats
MMKNKILTPFKYFTMLVMALSLTFLTNCSDDDDVEDLVDATDPDDGLNIIESLQAAGGYDTLLFLMDFYAVDAEGTKLIDVLVTDGPFTLFAPNNDAFAALYDVVGVSKAADVSPLIIAQLLGYHGAGGQLNELIPGSSVKTVQGEDIIINDGTTAASDGTIPEIGTLLTGSNTKNIVVSSTYIGANNGVIYNVETVLIPPSVGATLAAILQTNAASLLISDGLSIMGAAVTAADNFAKEAGLPSLIAALSNRDVKSTVFAIPNPVFEGAGLGVEAFSPQEWYGIISHHVVSGTSGYAATGEQDSVLYAEYIVGEDWPAAGKSVSSNLVVGQTEAGAPINAQLHIQYLQGVGNFSGVFIDSDGHAAMGYTAANDGFFNAEVMVPDFQKNTNGVVHLIAGYLAPSFDCNGSGLGCAANFAGVFNGTTYDAATSTFNFPSNAESYAGFANDNKKLYPLSFPNGGKITFTASAPNDAVGVYFKFEKDVYPDVEPRIHTDTVAVTGSTDSTYTIEFQGSPVSSDSYKSFLMYLATRDADVIIKDIYVTASGDGSGPGDGTGQEGSSEYADFKNVFNGTTYDSVTNVYNFPTGSESYAGFANANTDLYPFSFPNGGSITFLAAVQTAGDEVNVNFRFEKAPYPDVDPAFSTANVLVTGTVDDEKAYTVEIPAQDASNTYSSLIMYLVENDVPVEIHDVLVVVNP